MEEDSPIIYGLEFQARALASLQSENDIVKFIVGTQSLKLSQNQLHLVQVNDETHSLETKIYSHPEGEVWHLHSSADPDLIVITYNTLTEDNVCRARSALRKIGTDSLSDEILLPTQQYDSDVKQTVFHPTDPSKLLSIVDKYYILWDVKDGAAKVAASGSLEGKGQLKMNCIKWNPHHNVTQCTTVNESNIRGWDLRSGTQSWLLDSTHSQMVRDVDFNPNRQYYLASCGDDGCTKFWDVRNTNEPVIVRADHSHWVWSVRYNHFHDQLVLTSSSDSRVILTRVAGISSEPGGHLIMNDENTETSKDKLEEGVLSTYEEHEDSVYCVEWSTADPWTFASLSYDGRLVVNKVPRLHKYKILL